MGLRRYLQSQNDYKKQFSSFSPLLVYVDHLQFTSLSFIMLFNTFVLFLSSILLTGISKVVDAQALATFYSGIGPTIVAQDPSTGNFLYNVRSAKGFSSMQTINVKTTPKNGTAIASTGYSGSSSIYVSLSMKDLNS